MKQVWRRIIFVALALALMLPLMPQMAKAGTFAYDYVMTTKGTTVYTDTTRKKTLMEVPQGYVMSVRGADAAMYRVSIVPTNYNGTKNSILAVEGYINRADTRVMTDYETEAFNIFPYQPKGEMVDTCTVRIGYIADNKGNVNVREEPSVDADTVRTEFSMDGSINSYSKTKFIILGGIVDGFYKVRVGSKVGYIKSDFVVPIAATGGYLYSDEKAVLKSADASDAIGSVKLSGTTNVYRTPYAGSYTESFTTLKAGTYDVYGVRYYGVDNIYTSYIVKTASGMGYVTGSASISKEGSMSVYGNMDGSMSPNLQPKKVTINSKNPKLLTMIAGKDGKLIQGIAGGATGMAEMNGSKITMVPVKVECYGIKEGTAGNTFYMIKYDDGNYYWIYSINATLEGDPTPSPTAKSTVDPSKLEEGYISVTATDGVKVRAEASESADVLGTASKNTEMYFVAKKDVSGKNWYNVVYGDAFGWVCGDDVSKPYTKDTPVVTATPAPTATAAPMYVTTKIAKVVVRPGKFEPDVDGTPIVTIDAIGSKIYPYTGEAKVNGKVYYGVNVDGKQGWIMAKYARICNKDGTNYASTPSPTPYGWTPVPDSFNYVKTIDNSVNIRKTPSTTGTVLMTVSKQNTVLPYYSTTSGDGKNWYYVKTAANTFGYIRADWVTICDKDGNAISGPVTPVPTYSPYITPVPVGGNYVKTTDVKVNIREQTSTASKALDQVPTKGTILPYYASSVLGTTTWYQVSYNGKVGWMTGKFCLPCDASGNPIYGPIITTSPVYPTWAPTSAPVSGNYVTTTATYVNLRKSASITSKSLRQIPKTGTTLRYTKTTKSAGVTWYYVSYGGDQGWVHGGFVKVSGGGGGNTTPTPSYTEVESTGTVKTTAVRLNVRNSCEVIETNVVTQIPNAGTTVPYYKVANANGTIWYYISYNGRLGWVMGNYCTPVSSGIDYTYGYLMTTNEVNLRASASTASAVEAVVSKGHVFTWDQVMQVGNENWYRVVFNNKYVWVLGTYTQQMTQAEYQAYISGGTVTPAPVVQSGYVTTKVKNVYIRKWSDVTKTHTELIKEAGTTRAFTEAKRVGAYTYYRIGTDECLRSDVVYVSSTPEHNYTTLKLGDNGVAVSNLVYALRQKGFYTGADTSTYTTEVKAAVEAYQNSKGLLADGIASPNLQVMIFEQSSEGSTVTRTSSTTGRTIQLYTAEKVDWSLSSTNTLWADNGVNMVYDLNSGEVWAAKREYPASSGQYHWDVEPLTAADSNAFLRMYGVSSTSQINSTNHYQRRPCLVTIGTRTFAVSMYGVPHGDQTILENNFNGQVCLHCMNSRTHGTGNIDADHQDAINRAWLNSPSGHK